MATSSGTVWIGSCCTHAAPVNVLASPSVRTRLSGASIVLQAFPKLGSAKTKVAVTKPAVTAGGMGR